jgi:hypothetical protein
MFEYDMDKPQYWFKTMAVSGLKFLKLLIEDVEHQCDETYRKFIEERDIYEEVDEERQHFYRVELHRDFDSDSFDLESIFAELLPNMQRGAALILVFGHFENELTRLCYLYHKKFNYESELTSYKKIGITEAIGYLKRVAGLNFSTNTPLWCLIKDISEVRNRFAHHRGHIDTASLFGPDTSEPNFTDEVLPPVAPPKFIASQQKVRLDGTYIILEKGYLESLLPVFEHFYTVIQEALRDVEG